MIRQVAFGRDGYGLRNVADYEDGVKYDKNLAKRTLGYAKPFKRQIALALTLTVVAAITTAIGPILNKIAIDTYVGRRDLPGLTAIVLLTLLVYSATFLCNWAQLYIITKVGQEMLQAMRSQLFRHLQKLSLSYFDRVPSGVVVSRVINDVQVINDLLTNGILTALSDCLTLLLTVVVMFALSPRLALVTFAVMPIMVYAMYIFTEKAKVAYRGSRATVAAVTGDLAESINGVRVIQAFSREEESQEQFDTLNEKNRVANIKANTLASALQPVIESTNALATVAVIAYGGFLIVNHQSTLGTVIAFLAYITRFFTPIRTLTQFYNQVQAATAGAEKVFEMMDEPTTIEEKTEPVFLTEVRGEIEFVDVSFSYGREAVLDHVSFRGEPGQMVAMVGHTGAGKTTVASLLARFYDPADGAVLLDGHDLRDLSFQSLRRSVGLVLQDNFLFSGTIADNIRYSRKDATDEEVRAAAQVANAHEFIERMTEGYETRVMERAANLSLGQRQLIAIARAIIADPRVLILDEATSNIDSQTEMLVQQALYKLLAGRTSLVIAHRLSTIRAADQVLVLDAGRIVERGRHEELLRAGGFYARLYQQQFAEATAAA
jgi:ATP-binding cassette, subfamily B, multidrug efflux pump